MHRIEIRNGITQWGESEMHALLAGLHGLS